MKTFLDNRGVLIFPIKDQNFSCAESTISINRKDVFRGVHVEEFEKLVVCAHGRVLDIIIDFDETSPEYLQPQYFWLDPKTSESSVITRPKQGHAFLSLEDDSILVYYYSRPFDPKHTQKVNFRDPMLGIKLPIPEQELIISKEDDEAPYLRTIDCVMFGWSGFIGGIIGQEVSKTMNVFRSLSRLEETEKIRSELIRFRPRHVVNCAGISTPISWCEDNKIPTIETNITGQLTLAKICQDLGIHLVVIGSGVIFDDRRVYSEEDRGNFFGNFYSTCRIVLEDLFRHYNNLLYLRVNYPISHIASPKNLLTKLIMFSRIQDASVSISYLDELATSIPVMMKTKKTGIVNFVNDGQVSLVWFRQCWDRHMGTESSTTFETMETPDPTKSFSRLECGSLLQYGEWDVKQAIETCIQKYISCNTKGHTRD